MKLVVDKDKCIGCGACVAISPANFDFDDDGLSTVIGEEITDETRNAIDACPVYAISIDEVKEDKAIEKDDNDIAQEHPCECGCECWCEHDDECACEHDCKCEDECNCSDEHNCGCKHDCSSEDDELEEAA